MQDQLSAHMWVHTWQNGVIESKFARLYTIRGQPHQHIIGIGRGTQPLDSCGCRDDDLSTSSNKGEHGVPKTGKYRVPKMGEHGVSKIRCARSTDDRVSTEYRRWSENGVPKMVEHGVPKMVEHGVPKMGKHGVPKIGEHGVP